MGEVRACLPHGARAPARCLAAAPLVVRCLPWRHACMLPWWWCCADCHGGTPACWLLPLPSRMRPGDHQHLQHGQPPPLHWHWRCHVHPCARTALAGGVAPAPAHRGRRFAAAAAARATAAAAARAAAPTAQVRCYVLRKARVPAPCPICATLRCPAGPVPSARQSAAAQGECARHAACYTSSVRMQRVQGPALGTHAAPTCALPWCDAHRSPARRRTREASASPRPRPRTPSRSRSRTPPRRRASRSRSRSPARRRASRSRTRSPARRRASRSRSRPPARRRTSRSPRRSSHGRGGSRSPARGRDRDRERRRRSRSRCGGALSRLSRVRACMHAYGRTGGGCLTCAGAAVGHAARCCAAAAAGTARPPSPWTSTSWRCRRACSSCSGARC